MTDRGNYGNSHHGCSQDQSPEHRTIRVNQAGEYGAVQIYRGQLAILKKSPLAPVLEEMLQQEKDHLQRFNALMVARRVRPTLLSPLWSLAGYGLGVVSAALGTRAAMACTVAVEEVIEVHYEHQKNWAQEKANDPELLDTIKACQHDETHHKNIAIEQGALEMPGYKFFRAVVRGASKTAIWLSKRL